MYINKTMIYGGPIRLQDMYTLNRLGFEFVIEDGKVTKVIAK